MKYIAILTVSAVCLGGLTSFAKDTPQVSSMKQVLSGTPAAELPAKAANLVKQAKAADVKSTTVTVVKATVGMNPAAAPAIVGAIARVNPEVASLAASTASAQQPGQAAAIAKAAAAAAPAKANEILLAVAGAAPEQKLAVEKALSGYLVAGTANGPLPKGPTIGPPYVPLSGTPENVTPATSGEFPGGARNYSKP